MLDTKLLSAMLTKQLSEFSGVQVITIVHDEGILRRRDLLGCEAVSKQCRLWCHSIRKTRGIGQRHPVRCEIGVRVTRGDGEWMAVCISVARMPVAETGALFEAGITRPDKLRLGQSDTLQGRPHRRPGAFANTNGRYVG